MDNMTQKARKILDLTFDKVLEWREKVKVMKIKKEEKKGIVESKKEGKKIERIKVDISATSAAKATLVVLGIILATLFVFEIRETVYLFLAALFIAAALTPFVDWLEGRRVPRWLGILILYALAMVILTLVVVTFIPILTQEVPKLASSILGWVSSNLNVDTSGIQQEIANLEDLLQKLKSNLNQENISAGLSALGSLGQNALAIVQSVAGSIFTFIMLLVIAFFMIVEKTAIGEFFYSLLPTRYSAYAFQKVQLVQKGIGDWLRGQIILCMVIGVMTYIGLIILGMPYALTLAFLAGFTEFIPYIGPVIAAVPALLIAFNEPGLMWVWVLVLYVCIQTIENNVAVPLIMEKAVGLSAIAVMFAMYIGEHFFGVVGIIVAVPLAAAVQLFVQDYTEMDK